MNFDKLKETARKYEQKEEWRRAIEVYLKAIREFESGNDPVPDLSVYNRVGDLYLKANEPGAAVQAYERAADLYGEQGFYNNAIALCGKILRVNPGRIQTYLKLAHLHAHKNVVIEAKKNLLEYLERMNTLNQLDEAFKSVKDFADQFPGNKDIRLMLCELLRASSRNDEAREQLEKLASDLEARGDTIGARKTLKRLQALDAEEVPPEPVKAASPRVGPVTWSSSTPRWPRTVRRHECPAPAPGRPGRSMCPRRRLRISRPRSLRTFRCWRSRPMMPRSTSSRWSSSPTEAQLEASGPGDVAKAVGFEPTFAGEIEAPDEAPMDGLQLDEPPPHSVELNISTEGLLLERASLPSGADYEPVELPDELLDTSELAGDYARGIAPPSDLDVHDSGLGIVDTGDVETLPADVGAAEETVTFLDVDAPAEPTISDLEDRVLEDPDDPEAHRALGEALLATGEPLRGQEELELALAGYEGREDWHRASDLIHELIRLDPNGVRYHQKRVEIAFRTGERPKLIEAYLELADALLRVGALDKALAVYRRVSEHDPGNGRALAALDALTPVEEPLPPTQAPPVAEVAAATNSGGAAHRRDGGRD